MIARRSTAARSCSLSPTSRSSIIIKSFDTSTWNENRSLVGFGRAVMRFREVLVLGAMASAAFCSACSPTMTVSSPTLMSGAQSVQGRRGVASTFHLDDRIIQVVDVTWPDVEEEGGVHLCEWKWYRDGKLISITPERHLNFVRTPFTLHTMRPAAPLGVGNFTVDTLIDGKVVAESAFVIVG